MATYYVVEGREFVPGERKKALKYAQDLADAEGRTVDVSIEKTYVTRDPSGFVYDSEVYQRSKKTVKPKRKPNGPRRSNPFPAHWTSAKVRTDSRGRVQVMLTGKAAKQAATRTTSRRRK